MSRASRIAGALVVAAGQAAAGLLVVVAVLQVAILVARKAGFATLGLQEIVSGLAVPAVLLAIPWALREGRHVAVDAFATRAARRVGSWLALVLAMTLLALALPYVGASVAAFEGSADFGGLPLRWLVKAVLLVLATLLAIEALSSIARGR